MKTVVVLSGKGGTGKTSVTASLAALEVAAKRKIVLADTDVDASNLHLLLQPSTEEENEYVAGRIAEVTPELCLGHGACAAHCRFHAISLEDEDGIVKARIDPGMCEGCAVCTVVCPEQAIAMFDQVAGTWRRGETLFGPIVDARLSPGGENSGKLVTKVRQAAREEAERIDADLLLMDGPPGVGCPVIAAVTGTDLVVAVTEPTPPALSDLKRLISLARHFNVPVAVVINKADLNLVRTEGLERRLSSVGIDVLGRIPYDESIPQALQEGVLPIDAAGRIAEAFTGIHERLGLSLAALSGLPRPGLLQVDSLGM